MRVWTQLSHELTRALSSSRFVDSGAAVAGPCLRRGRPRPGPSALVPVVRQHVRTAPPPGDAPGKGDAVRHKAASKRESQARERRSCQGATLVMVSVPAGLGGVGVVVLGRRAITIVIGAWGVVAVVELWPGGRGHG